MNPDFGTGMTHDVMEGSELFTSDGERLGKVKEIRAGYFKVDATMQPDYWLPMSLLSSTSGDRVMLTADKDHIDDHKMSEPRAA
jgi:hypothetical protein